MLCFHWFVLVSVRRIQNKAILLLNTIQIFTLRRAYLLCNMRSKYQYALIQYEVYGTMIRHILHISNQTITVKSTTYSIQQTCPCIENHNPIETLCRI